MLDHVLVPLDGSELSASAIPHAQRLLGPSGKMTLLTAFDVQDFPVYTYYPTPLLVETADFERATKELLPKAREHLEKIAEPLRSVGLDVRVIAELGEPAALIVDTAVKLNVDAIVMSTHGRSGFSRWLFGSVTNKVLSATHCPVYVVPGREPVKVEKAEVGEEVPEQVTPLTTLRDR
jgi:nucleotide-binding universal stress UspA family protein